MVDFKKRFTKLSRTDPVVKIKREAGVSSHALPSISWINNIQVIEREPKQNLPSYPVSFVIGLGDTGKAVLSQIKLNYLVRHQNEIPKEIRLLLIESPTISAEDILGCEERVPFPNISIPEYPALAEYPSFEWVQPASGHPDHRVATRARYVAAHLQNHSHSALYAGLQALLYGVAPNQTLSVYLVGNLAEADSAFIWDVAFLLRNRVAYATGVKIGSMRFNVFLGLESTPAELPPGEIFAGLREIERFTQHGKSVFAYPDPNFDGVDAGPIIDYCFLIDSQLHQKPELILSRQSVEQGIAKVISEALIALLDPGAGSITQGIGGGGETADELVWEGSRPLVSSIGVSTWAVPVSDLRKALNLRILRTLFFGGDFPDRIEGYLANPADIASSGISFYEQNQQEAMRFFSLEIANHHACFPAVVEAVRKRIWQKQDQDWSLDLDDLFGARLAEWMTVQLNRSTDGGVFINRSGRLFELNEQLTEVKNILEQAIAVPFRPVGPRADSGRAVRERLQAWLRIVELSQVELRKWQAAFIGEQNQEESSRRFSRRKQDERVDTFRQRLESGWRKHRSRLNEQLDAPICRALLSYGEDQPPYLGLEYSLYVKYVRPEMGIPPGDPFPILDQLASRVGWVCLYRGSSVETYFLVAATDFSGADGIDISKIIQQIGYSPETLQAADERLLNLVNEYTGFLQDEEVKTYLDAIDTQRVIEHLEMGRYPLLPYNSLDLPRGKTLRQSHYLIANDLQTIEHILAHMRPYEPQFVQRGQFGDRALHPITLLSLHHYIHLPATRCYARERQSYTPQPYRHIFLAEQRTAKAEKVLRSLHAERVYLDAGFISVLQIGNLADVFLRGWIYEYITSDVKSGTWFVPETAGFEALNLQGEDASLFAGLKIFALEMPCSDGLHYGYPLAARQRAQYEQALSQAIRTQAVTKREQREERFRQVEKEILPDLKRHRRPEYKSLAYYLEYMLEEERVGII